MTGTTLKRLAEGTAFVALAVGLHVVLAIRVPDKGGTDAGGQGGQAFVTLQGAPPGTVDMVERWETPPEVTETPQEVEIVEPVAMQSPVTPVTPTPPAPRPAFPSVTLPDAMPETTALPQVEMDVPPPPEPEAEPEEQPEPEPEVAEETPQETPEDQPEEVAEEQLNEMTPTTSSRPQARPRDFTPQVAKRPEKAEDGPRQQASRAGGAGAATQRAAGNGGSQQAGRDNGSVRAGSGGDTAKLQAVWGNQIRVRIERKKRFPGGMRGKSGRVIVRLTVSRDGNVLGAKVVRSSGHAEFDRAALQAIRRAGRMPAAPEGITQSSHTFNLPMGFS